MEEKEKNKKQSVCLACGATSKEVVLLPCIRNEEEEHVCVHCLPALIHSS